MHINLLTYARISFQTTLSPFLSSLNIPFTRSSKRTRVLSVLITIIDYYLANIQFLLPWGNIYFPIMLTLDLVVWLALAKCEWSKHETLNLLVQLGLAVVLLWLPQEGHSLGSCFAFSRSSRMQYMSQNWILMSWVK